jgi:hypothetical protein
MPVITPEMLAQIGPIGILFILALVVYLQLGPRLSRQHLENSKKLDDILAQLVALNGRVGKIEEWRDGHDKQDDERERRHDESHRAFHEELGRAREGVHAVRNELAAASVRAALEHHRTGGG